MTRPEINVPEGATKNFNAVEQRAKLLDTEPKDAKPNLTIIEGGKGKEGLRVDQNTKLVRMATPNDPADFRLGGQDPSYRLGSGNDPEFKITTNVEEDQARSDEISLWKTSWPSHKRPQPEPSPQRESGKPPIWTVPTKEESTKKAA